MNELNELKLFLQRFLDNMSFQFQSFAEQLTMRLERLEQRIKQLEEERKNESGQSRD